MNIRSAQQTLQKHIDATIASRPKKKAKADSAGAAIALMFERGADRGVAVDMTVFSSLQPIRELKEPRGFTEVSTEQVLEDFCNETAGKFSKSNLRELPEGRAELPCKGAERSKAAADLFKLFVADDAILPTEHLPKEMVPASFAIKAGHEFCSAERGRASTLRVQTTGTRELLLTPCASIKEYLSKVKLITSNGPEACKRCFETMGKDGLEEYMNSGAKVFYCTLSPGQAVAVPMDYLWYERVKPGADCSGMRFSMALQSDSDAWDALNRWLISTGNSSDFVRKVSEGFALMD